MSNILVHTVNSMLHVSIAGVRDARSTCSSKSVYIMPQKCNYKAQTVDSYTQRPPPAFVSLLAYPSTGAAMPGMGTVQGPPSNQRPPYH